MSGSTIMSVTHPFNLMPDPVIPPDFESRPWARAIYSDPALHAFNHPARIQLPSTREDTFVARTLNTKDTVESWQSFIKDPVPSPASPTKHEIPEVWSIMSLGGGLNGHHDITHGGMVSVILDEAIGTAAQMTRPMDKTTMTAFLRVDYKKPIPTPNVVLCRSWIEKIEGRKLWGRGSIEDGLGNVLALGEALFIIVERIVPTEKL
jgi:thioesterase superfamily protein 4